MSALLNKIFFMHLIWIICGFMLGSSLLMVGYVLVRDIENTRSQASEVTGQNEESYKVTETPEEIVAEYPHLVRKIA